MYQMLLYPQFQICFIIYCVWADKTVDIMGHLYIISRIGLPSSLYSCYISTVIGDSSYGVSSDFFMCALLILVHVKLVCPFTTLYQFVQKYPVRSNFD